MNGASARLSARQSPSSQSIFVLSSGNVVVTSHSLPERLKLATAAAMLANDRCTRQSRHRIASARGKASRVMSASKVVARNSGAFRPAAQIIDQLRHDIDPGIGHADIEIRNPAAIAAGGIEQRRRAELTKKTWQPLPQVCRRIVSPIQVRTPSRRRPRGWSGGCDETARRDRARKMTIVRPRTANARAPEGDHRLDLCSRSPAFVVHPQKCVGVKRRPPCPSSTRIAAGSNRPAPALLEARMSSAISGMIHAPTRTSLTLIRTTIYEAVSARHSWSAAPLRSASSRP